MLCSCCRLPAGPATTRSACPSPNLALPTAHLVHQGAGGRHHRRLGLAHASLSRGQGAGGAWLNAQVTMRVQAWWRCHHLPMRVCPPLPASSTQSGHNPCHLLSPAPRRRRRERRPQSLSLSCTPPRAQPAGVGGWGGGWCAAGAGVGGRRGVLLTQVRLAGKQGGEEGQRPSILACWAGHTASHRTFCRYASRACL